jgi:replication factor A1
VKLDNKGQPELRLGRGKLAKSEEVIAVPPRELSAMSQALRTDIKELKEGDMAEVRGCLVQLFRRNPFYDTCPECGARLTEDKGVFTCRQHGKVQPAVQMVVSGVADDGTGNIRVVFFRELAEKVMGNTAAALQQSVLQSKDPLAFFDQIPMGRDFLVQGRVKKNDFTENLELVANDIQEMDVKKEAQLLLKKLQEQ